MDLNEPDLFKQLPSVSKTPTPSASLKSTGPKSPSLKMSEPSQQMDLEGLTSSAAGSPASPGGSPGSSEAQKMTAISGQRWLPLLKSYGLSGSLAKTCEALLTSPWGSSAAFLTWRGSGTAPSHLLFQLAPLTPRTAGTGSGLWQTPNANEDRAECYTLETSYKHRQEGRQIHLAQEVRDQRLWPTPTTPTGGGERSGDRAGTGNLHYMARSGQLWPTPVATDHKGSGKTGELRDRLDYAVERGATKAKVYDTPQASGSLNPTWVEWLMGFPTGWTDLNASETPSSQPSLSKSDGQSLKDGSDDVS